MKVFEIVSEYQDRYPLSKKFAETLKPLFGDLLVQNNISFLQIETRVKSLPSFLDKVYRVLSSGREFSYDCTDLIGVRLITYYMEDVYQIAELIEKSFKVHSQKKEYDAFNRSPDQFGYSSLHYKVSLLPGKRYSQNLEAFQYLVFEVQIRTVAQHAWATIDHKLRYKTTEQIPKPILRQIFQLSALFELADTQFAQIKKQLELQAQHDLEMYKSGDLSARINALTLEYFLEKYRPIIKALLLDAQQIGFSEMSVQHDPNTIRYLLTILKRLGITTMGELENLINEAEQKRTAMLQDIFRVVSRKSNVPMDYPFPVFIFILIFLRLNTVSLESIDVKEIILKLLGSSEYALSVSSRKPMENRQE